MRVSRILTALAVASALLAVPIATVNACSCVGFTVQEAVAAADIAFVGTLTATSAEPDPNSMEPITWRFDVERANREVSGAKIDISAPVDSGANCGVSFGIGERWLVLASRIEGSLTSSSCAGNVPMSAADPQLAAFVEEAMAPVSTPPPAAAPEAAPSASSLPLIPIGIGLAVVAVVVVASGVLYARRSPRRR